MRNAFSTTFSIYLVLSLLCALYFGETIMPTITLNFRRFTLLPVGEAPQLQPIQWTLFQMRTTKGIHFS